MHSHTKFARTALAAALIAGLAVLAPAGGASAYTYKVIHDFCSKQNCVDGASPRASVTVNPDGTLVGTTASGTASSDRGTAFRLSFAQVKDKWRYQRLHAFCKGRCPDGLDPIAPLIIDTAGNLYGTTFNGENQCGTIFELSSPTRGQKPQFTVLYTFTAGAQCPSGGHVEGRLAYAGQSSGLLYDGTSPLIGTAASGGADDEGVVFMLTPGTPWTYTILHDFCSQAQCADGRAPTAGVTLDANGNIFGAAEGGGIENRGTAFELQSPGWTYNKLYDFCQSRRCADGSGPNSELVFDAAGNLFGTTGAGGTAHKGCCGTIYKLTPQGSGWSESVLYSFCSRRNCLDGNNPSGPLVLDASGALIGTTITGGGNNSVENTSGGGTVYRFDGTSLQTLYSFCAQPQCTDGAGPFGGGVSVDQAGELFGTTFSGGKYDAGAVFELSP